MIRFPHEIFGNLGKAFRAIFYLAIFAIGHHGLLYVLNHFNISFAEAFAFYGYFIIGIGFVFIFFLIVKAFREEFS